MAKSITLREHWEHIYETKPASQVSWTQTSPQPSLDWIQKLKLDPKDLIVDCGGGRSALAEQLVDSGHLQVEVFDISIRSMAQAKLELKSEEARQNISYRVCNVLDYKPEKQVQLWHDRAVFHFMTEKTDIETYVELVEKMAPAHVVLGTFGLDAPDECSGLAVKRYDASTLSALFSRTHELVQSEDLIHRTPSGKEQHFTFVQLKLRGNL